MSRGPEKWYGNLHWEPYHLKKWYGFGRVCRIGSGANELDQQLCHEIEAAMPAKCGNMLGFPKCIGKRLPVVVNSELEFGCKVARMFTL